MDFTLRRKAEGRDSTAGELLDTHGSVICSSLEQEWNHNAPRESRIPAGRYRLQIKKLGTSRFDEEYKKKFGGLHRGMIEIIGVDGRSQILFHMGNYHRHTEGCVLLGSRVEKVGENWQIPPGESRPGYLPAYELITAAIMAGPTFCTITDPPAPEPLIS